MMTKLKQIFQTLVVELQLAVMTKPAAPILALTILSSKELLGQLADLEQRSNPLMQTATLDSPASTQGSRQGISHVSVLFCQSETNNLGAKSQPNVRMSSRIQERKLKVSLVQLASLWSNLMRKVRFCLFWLLRYRTEQENEVKQAEWKSLTEMATEGAFLKGRGSTQLQLQRSSETKTTLGAESGSTSPRVTEPENMSPAKLPLGQLGSWQQHTAAIHNSTIACFILVLLQHNPLGWDLKTGPNQQTCCQIGAASARRWDVE